MGTAPASATNKWLRPTVRHSHFPAPLEMGMGQKGQQETQGNNF